MKSNGDRLVFEAGQAENDSQRSITLWIELFERGLAKNRAFLAVHHGRPAGELPMRTRTIALGRPGPTRPTFSETAGWAATIGGGHDRGAGQRTAMPAATAPTTANIGHLEVRTLSRSKLLARVSDDGMDSPVARESVVTLGFVLNAVSVSSPAPIVRSETAPGDGAC